MEIFEAASSLPAELLTAVGDIKSAFDKRANAERAATMNRDAIALAELRIVQLEASSKELDAQAIKAFALAEINSGLKGELTSARKAADKAAAELSDERRANERRVAAGAILDAEARAVDEAIPDLEKRFLAAIKVHGDQILSAVRERLVEACAPLALIIHEVAAIDAVFPNGGLARKWLDCAKLISPVGYRSTSMDGYVRVQGTDLLATNVPLPSLPVGAATAIQELVAVSKAIKQYRKYQPPKRPQLDVQRPRLSTSDRRWNEQQNQAIENWKPPESTFHKSGQGSHDIREPRTPAPRSESNMNAGADLDGSISDEWRRIDPTYDGDRPRQGGR